MSTELFSFLATFKENQKIQGKGALALVVHISRYARENSLPLDAVELITEGSGQVLGLGRGSVQHVLKDYGISRVLAEEGGRTNRGNIGIMRAYVAFLNDLHTKGIANLDDIENWWIERVKEHFAAKPIKLHFDASKGLQTLIQDLLAQAKKRQQESTGTMYQGALLQHLVGAKLELALPEVSISHNGFSVADAANNRLGDFVIDGSIIHVTTFPGEAVIRKCQQNLDAGTKPIIITIAEGVPVAKGLANNAGLLGRIDIMEAEQFLAANLHELSLFKASVHRSTLESLIVVYNRIVAENETDPSLQIEIG